MRAYLFPGQGSQFPGMGKDLFDASAKARTLFSQANETLGFDISKVMFDGTEEDLRQTKITQPAVFIHSVIKAATLDNFNPEMVAGHSLGEFSALVAAGSLNYANALKLVHKRALAMQKACELEESTMAAVLGMDDDLVGELCTQIDGIVVPANYNCPGQLVISGSMAGIDNAVPVFEEAGAKKVIKLPVGGAFHSPLMEPAKLELEKAIDEVEFAEPTCPIYQNAVAKAVTVPSEIKQNLKDQLTAPVRWTQSIQAMIKDGGTVFSEVGPGSVLQGLMRKIDRTVAFERV